jgi:hypothetical protein
MCRVIRVSPARDQGFEPLHGHVHGDHGPACRLVVLPIAWMWRRRPVAHGSRSLAAAPRRTRVHTCCRVARWEPEAALRQPAQAWRRVLPPGQGKPLAGRLDDAKPATRGQAMDAIATRQDPTTAGSRRAHQGVGGLRRFRQHVRPWGLRLEVTPAAWAAGGVPCQHTTPWAAHLMREVNAPAGVKVSVW